MDLYIKKQIFIAGCIYLGAILVGFGMGWTAPVIPKLQDPELTPLPRVITDGEASWVGSLLYVGTIIGPHISGYMSNILGRKPCLMLGGFLTMVSFFMVVMTRSFAMVLATRIVMGFGIGIIAVSNFIYIGEIASTNIRGVLLTASGIFSTLGTLVIYSAGPYVSYAGTGYLGMALCAVYILGLFFVPETHVFYLMKGQTQEAKHTLIALGRENETDTALSTKPLNKENTNAWTQLFTKRANFRALYVTLILGILQQMSGVVVVIFFATTIFEMAGSTIEANLATIIIGLTQIVASTITPFFVERVGRKMLLLVSTAACCVALAVLGVYFRLDAAGYSMERVGWMPLVTLIIFFLSYDMGFGIIPGTLTGELYHATVRGSGSALSVTSAWLVGFGIASAFGYMLTALGAHYTFWLFSGACALAFVFTAVAVPETKGKSLNEIQDMLSR